eukprot:TRINITY_DN7092_c0_g2_i1.p1 TRINITY_DN7092_c0_g2~~TRINITY_DN7092_c0_g2_i1.p1  ORF type:complete len:1007 (+),score=167.93 TRINITY_DN7092_c0_g2_i1:120-3140(+)
MRKAQELQPLVPNADCSTSRAVDAATRTIDGLVSELAGRVGPSRQGELSTGRSVVAVAAWVEEPLTQHQAGLWSQVSQAEAPCSVGPQGQHRPSAPPKPPAQAEEPHAARQAPRKLGPSEEHGNSSGPLPPQPPRDDIRPAEVVELQQVSPPHVPVPVLPVEARPAQDILTVIAQPVCLQQHQQDWNELAFDRYRLMFKGQAEEDAYKASMQDQVILRTLNGQLLWIFSICLAQPLALFRQCGEKFLYVQMAVMVFASTCCAVGWFRLRWRWSRCAEWEILSTAICSLLLVGALPSSATDGDCSGHLELGSGMCTLMMSAYVLAMVPIRFFLKVGLSIGVVIALILSIVRPDCVDQSEAEAVGSMVYMSTGLVGLLLLVARQTEIQSRQCFRQLCIQARRLQSGCAEQERAFGMMTRPGSGKAMSTMACADALSSASVPICGVAYPHFSGHGDSTPGLSGHGAVSTTPTVGTKHSGRHASSLRDHYRGQMMMSRSEFNAWPTVESLDSLSSLAYSVDCSALGQEYSRPTSDFIPEHQVPGLAEALVQRATQKAVFKVADYELSKQYQSYEAELEEAQAAMEQEQRRCWEVLEEEREHWNHVRLQDKRMMQEAIKAECSKHMIRHALGARPASAFAVPKVGPPSSSPRRPPEPQRGGADAEPPPLPERPKSQRHLPQLPPRPKDDFGEQGRQSGDLWDRFSGDQGRDSLDMWRDGRSKRMEHGRPFGHEGRDSWNGPDGSFRESRVSSFKSVDSMIQRIQGNSMTTGHLDGEWTLIEVGSGRAADFLTSLRIEDGRVHDASGKTSSLYVEGNVIKYEGGIMSLTADGKLQRVGKSGRKQTYHRVFADAGQEAEEEDPPAPEPVPERERDRRERDYTGSTATTDVPQESVFKPEVESEVDELRQLRGNWVLRDDTVPIRPAAFLTKLRIEADYIVDAMDRKQRLKVVNGEVRFEGGLLSLGGEGCLVRIGKTGQRLRYKRDCPATTPCAMTGVMSHRSRSKESRFPTP